MGISLIIPVYNGEKYLAECLDSVVTGTDVSLEVIIVNDGSTDRSAEICEEYKQKYDFIKLIHRKNDGVSSARNEGIAAASMEYVGFLDADDVCKPGMHKKLLERIKESGADFCFCGSAEYNHDLTKVTHRFINKQYMDTGGAEAALAFARDRLYIGISCFIVRRDLLFKRNITFTPGCRYGEDDEFTLKCLLHSANVSSVHEICFCYRRSNIGVTANVSLRRFDNIYALLRLLDYAKEHFPDNVPFYSVLEKMLIPMRILDVFYLLATNRFDYDTLIAHIRQNGLDLYMRGARGARVIISIMIILWRISPRLLYKVILLKS